LFIIAAYPEHYLIVTHGGFLNVDFCGHALWHVVWLGESIALV